MKKTYDDVTEAFKSGTVLTASKAELEQMLVAIGEAQILSAVNIAKASQMGETMRQLLAVRQSQEAHGSSMVVSKVALLVAVIALLVSLFQAIVSLNIIAPLKSPILHVGQVKESPSETYKRGDG